MVPAGKSHSTVQPLRVVVPVFFTVHCPWKPVPQSETLVYVAVADSAACAGVAPRPMSAATGRRSAVRAARALRRAWVVRVRVPGVTDAPR